MHSSRIHKFKKYLESLDFKRSDNDRGLLYENAEGEQVTIAKSGNVHATYARIRAFNKHDSAAEEVLKIMQEKGFLIRRGPDGTDVHDTDGRLCGHVGYDGDISDDVLIAMSFIADDAYSKVANPGLLNIFQDGEKLGTVEGGYMSPYICYLVSEGKLHA